MERDRLLKGALAGPVDLESPQLLLLCAFVRVGVTVEPTFWGQFTRRLCRSPAFDMGRHCALLWCGSCRVNSDGRMGASADAHRNCRAVPYLGVLNDLQPQLQRVFHP